MREYIGERETQWKVRLPPAKATEHTASSGSDSYEGKQQKPSEANLESRLSPTVTIGHMVDPGGVGRIGGKVGVVLQSTDMQSDTPCKNNNLNLLSDLNPIHPDSVSHTAS